MFPATAESPLHSMGSLGLAAVGRIGRVPEDSGSPWVASPGTASCSTANNHFFLSDFLVLGELQILVLQSGY